MRKVSSVRLIVRQNNTSMAELLKGVDLALPLVKSILHNFKIIYYDGKSAVLCLSGWPCSNHLIEVWPVNLPFIALVIIMILLCSLDSTDLKLMLNQHLHKSSGIEVYGHRRLLLLWLKLFYNLGLPAWAGDWTHSLISQFSIRWLWPLSHGDALVSCETWETALVIFMSLSDWSFFTIWGCQHGLKIEPTALNLNSQSGGYDLSAMAMP